MPLCFNCHLATVMTYTNSAYFCTNSPWFEFMTVDDEANWLSVEDNSRDTMKMTPYQLNLPLSNDAALLMILQIPSGHGKPISA